MHSETARQRVTRELDTFAAANYTSLPVNFTRGDGAVLYDDAGNACVDMMSTYSASSFGHRHPGMLKAMFAQALHVGPFSRAYMSGVFADFCKTLSECADVDLGADGRPAKVLPANGGAEAVETAIKLARKWCYDRTPADRRESVAPVILFADGNFHGRTIAISGASNELLYRQGFGPFPDGIVRVPYNDTAKLEEAIRRIDTTANTRSMLDVNTGQAAQKEIRYKVAAFIVEPVQGEAGIKLPRGSYLKEAFDVCRRHGVLFIADEIQTGLGRTGKLWATQHDGVRPDARIIGKALGGGLYPVSAVVARPEVMDAIKPGSHGSTFGGNAIASVIAREALLTLRADNEAMVRNAAERGEQLMSRLAAMRARLEEAELGHYIREIRGKGLFIGVEINHGEPGKDGHAADPVHPRTKTTARTVCEMLLAEGVISKETHDTVIRLAPPFCITEEQMDYAIAAFERVIHTHAALLAKGGTFDIGAALDSQRNRTVPGARPVSLFDGIAEQVNAFVNKMLNIA